MIGLIGVCLVLYLAAAELKKDYPYLYYLFSFMFVTMFLVLTHGVTLYLTDVGGYASLLAFVTEFEINLINMYVFFVNLLSLLLTGRLFLWGYQLFVKDKREVINV